jgi:hypothetical protein
MMERGFHWIVELAILHRGVWLLFGPFRLGVFVKCNMFVFDKLVRTVPTAIIES